MSKKDESFSTKLDSRPAAVPNYNGTFKAIVVVDLRREFSTEAEALSEAMFVQRHIHSALLSAPIETHENKSKTVVSPEGGEPDVAAN